MPFLSKRKKGEFEDKLASNEMGWRMAKPAPFSFIFVVRDDKKSPWVQGLSPPPPIWARW